MAARDRIKVKFRCPRCSQILTLTLAQAQAHIETCNQTQSANVKQ